MPVTVTADDLFNAVHHKFPKAALLAQVTMEDADALKRQRTADALRSPYYRRLYAKRGFQTDAELPEGYDPTTEVTSRRIDALMVEGKYFTAIEIKISRADFFKDTAAKRAPWRRHTHRFAYLVPEGLVTVLEVPSGCALWEYMADGSILVTKRATVNENPEPFPQAMVRYFMWRAFSAEQANPRRGRNRSRRAPKRR